MTFPPTPRHLQFGNEQFLHMSMGDDVTHSSKPVHKA